MEGGTFNRKALVAQTESNMMKVLLDISGRITNLELKGNEMLTATSIKEVLHEIQKPMENDIQMIRSMLVSHGEMLNKWENTHLALNIKMKLTNAELKTHIDTTSSEYADLKTTHFFIFFFYLTTSHTDALCSSSCTMVGDG